MRVDRVELEVRAVEQIGQRTAQVVGAKTETVHAGVDFQVIPDALLVAGGGGLHGDGGAGRRNRRRQAAVEEAVEVADAQRAEHENLALDAGRPERGALFDVGARQQVGARALERLPDLRRAVPVRVRLDDRDHARRMLGLFGLQVTDDGRVVRGERVEIDAGDGRADHAPSARFSKRVNSRMNASFTTPVGPLRCLPMMSSATPCASVGGWLLS